MGKGTPGTRHKSGYHQIVAAGKASVGQTLTDAQALATAKMNLKLFEQLDDADPSDFVKTMEAWQQHPDVFESFWWWRDAHEKAAKNHEEFGGKEPCYRCFEVCQYLAKPWDFDSWEDDRVTLKPGVKPLITEEQVASALDHKTIKRWLWIWHYRDIYTEQDEITDRSGNAKAGERKFKHLHCWFECSPAQPISTIARWFGVPANMVEVKHGRGAFLDCAEYSVHESPKAVEQGKTHYEDDEVHCSPGFEFRKELTDLQAHRARYGKRAGEMTPADTMRMHVMQDGWTMKQCRDDDPLTYAKIRSTLPPLRLDYLLDSEPCPFRLNFYVDGPSGIGKTQFCKFLAESMFKAYEHPYFCIGSDERVTFDGYDGEPCIIWNDMRAVDFVQRFRASGTYKIFDPHPDKEAQQAKHSRVILTNAVNIINGIQSYQEFINGLAGTYIDKYGVRHEAEDDTQAWRRFPLIIRIEPDQLEVLVNMGFLDPENYTAKQILVEKRIRGRIADIFRRLDGEAKQVTLNAMTEPVIDTAHSIIAAHDDKIADASQLPEEFADFGTVITAEEIADEEYVKLQERWVADAELFMEYRVYLDEFAAIREYPEQVGPMPTGWTRGEHVPHVLCTNESSSPLTFAEWRYATSDGQYELGCNPFER